MSRETREHLLGHLLLIGVFVCWFGSDLGVELLLLLGVG